MLDLRDVAMTEWVAAYGSIDITRTAHGTGEGDLSLTDAIEAFGEALDISIESGPAPLEEALGRELTPPLADAMAHFDPARRLRLLHWLTEAGFDDPHRVIHQLTDPRSASGASLLRWVGALLRREQLARLFSQERIEALRNACRKAGQTEKNA